MLVYILGIKKSKTIQIISHSFKLYQHILVELSFKFLMDFPCINDYNRASIGLFHIGMKSIDMLLHFQNEP